MLHTVNSIWYFSRRPMRLFRASAGYFPKGCWYQIYE
jgi:hypothetical protein